MVKNISLYYQDCWGFWMTELGTKNLEPGLNQAVQYGTGSDFEDFRIEQVTAIKKGVPCESSLFF
jgi:hypothetical protein